MNAPAVIDRQRYQRLIRFFVGLWMHVIGWDIVLRRIAPNRVLATRPERWRTLSRRFRLLAVEMGGVLIKLGQFLSSRADVLPPEITDELQGLQDEVPAVPTEEILAVMRAELGDVDTHFAYIEPEPLAAASLGQVYRAWLCPHDKRHERGAPVVIKVQRPGIEMLVQTDLAALRRVARWMMIYPAIRRRADVPALLDEFAETRGDVLDYELVSDNAERFAEMFAGDDGVYIPLVFRRHSTRRVLVLENVEAIKITDIAAIEAAGVDRADVADRLLDTYFRQIFKESFFHADPHPGNLFVLPRTESLERQAGEPTPYYLIFVDFGMVGHIEALRGDMLRRVLIAISQRDARALVEAERDLGFLLPTADLERITEVHAVLLQQIWGRELLELTQPDPAEIQELTREFKDILFGLPFQIPQDFIYIGRAMGMLSGLSALLDPRINPWRKVEQYGRDIVRQSGAATIGWETVVAALRPLVTVPSQLQRVLTAAEQGRLRLQMTPDPATLQRLDSIERRLGFIQTILVAVAGVASSVLFFWYRRQETEKEK